MPALEVLQSQTQVQCNHCEKLLPASEFKIKKQKGQFYFDKRCRRCKAIYHRALKTQPKNRFSNARQYAKFHKKDWQLTPAEYMSLISMPCAYCGFSLPIMGCGLDRLDPSAGYVPGNVVPCCVECNLARNVSFTPEEMRMVGQTIRSIKEARFAAGQPLSLIPRRGRRRIYADY